MTGTLSPDGKWMWDGEQWIPAPPGKYDTAPQQFPEPVEEKVELSYTPTAPPSTSNTSVYSFESQRPESTKTDLASRKYKSTTLEDLTIKVIKKGVFPTTHLRIMFTNPATGVEHDVSFKTLARTWTARITNGHEIGKIKLNGSTIFSGTSGTINLPDGGIYNVYWKQGFLGVKSQTITLTNMATGTVLRTI